MIKFADLFAGMGGMGLGWEMACQCRGISTERVCTSEIKPHAITALKENISPSVEPLDITELDRAEADVFLAGFPCQAFSRAGMRRGFDDERGGMFFHLARLIESSRPKGFLLENVEGLLTHDHGKTMQTVLSTLEGMEYHTAYSVVDCSRAGVPQNRKRVFIVGSLNEQPDMWTPFQNIPSKTGDILEKGLPCLDTPFVRRLMSSVTSVGTLCGKCVNDKRGGDDNIHSWNIALKGDVTEDEKALLDCIMRERRKRVYAASIGVRWADGMPLTLEMIRSFFKGEGNLAEMLDDLTAKGYLHIKRIEGSDIEGYAVKTSRVSWEINRILDPESKCVTLTATDISHIGVADGDGIRRLTAREGLRMFGYPEWYDLTSVERKYGMKKVYDLLGNTVVVPAVAMVADRLLDTMVN